MGLRIPPALLHRRFALMWGGLLISIAGTQMQVAALHWHLSLLTDRPVVVSGIGIARFIPILLLAPIGGVAADNFNRRKILFITQTTMALVAVVLGVLTWTGLIRIWHIYLMTAVQAVAVSFDLPARQAMMPNLVTRETLPNAFSLQSIASNTGAIAGPMLGGLVIASLGLEYAYWFNAVSYLAVLAALYLMGSVAQETQRKTLDARATLSSIGEGWQFITHHPIIMSSMVLDFVATFFSSANTLLPFFVKNVLHMDEVAYGSLVSFESIGAVLVGLFFSQRVNIRRQGFSLMAAVVAFGLSTILLGISTSFVLAALGLALIGASDAVSTILRNTIRQIQTPDYIRGRMVSLNQIFFQGGPQLGEIEAGVVAQAFGLPFAIVSGGAACILGVFVIARIWPQLPAYRGDEPVLNPAPAG